MYIPRVSEFLGYCIIEEHPDSGWKQTLLNYRIQHGLSCEKFSRILKIDERGLRKIERGEEAAKITEEKIRQFLAQRQVRDN